MTVSSATLSPLLVSSSYSSTPMSVAAALAATSTTRSPSIQIVDTAENIARNIDALQSSKNKITNISFKDDDHTLVLNAKQVKASSGILAKINGGDYELSIKNALVAELTDLNANVKVTEIAVNDSSKNISLGLTRLNTSQEKVKSITQTGTPSVLTLTEDQLSLFEGTLNKITNNYSLSVTNVRTESMSRVAENSRVAAIGIVDTCAQIASHLDEMSDLGVRLVSAKTTDKEALSLTAEQLKTDGWVLGKIYNGYEISVRSANLVDAASLSKNGKVKLIDVEDTAANVIKNIDLLGKLGSSLNSITLTDSSSDVSISAAKFAQHAKVIDKITNPTVSFAVEDVAYAKAASVLGNSKVSQIGLSDTADVISKNFESIKLMDSRLSKITRLGSGTSLALTAANYEASADVFAKFRNSYSVALSDATVDKAIALAATAQVASVAVVDSSENMSANWNALNGLGVKLTQLRQVDSADAFSITASQMNQSASLLKKVSGNYALNVSEATVADLAKLTTNAKVSTIAVKDTSKNIAQKLDSLNQLGQKISDITLNDLSEKLDVTASQMRNLGATLDKIAGNYQMNVSQVFASDVFDTLAQSHVASVSVSDNSLNLSAHLTDLKNAGARLSRINQTGSNNAIKVAYADYLDNATTFAKIANSYSLAVDGVTAALATSVAAGNFVSSVAVSDSSANVQSKLTDLRLLGKELSTITLSDQTPIEINTAQLMANIGVLAKISNSYSLNMVGVSAANASKLAVQPNVNSVAISDSSINIAEKIDELGKINSKIASIVQSTTAAMNITGTQMLSNASLLTKISGDYSLNVRDVSATNVSDFSGNANVSTIAVKDTGENLVANLSSLNSATAKITKMQQLGSAPIQLTASQLNADGVILSKLESNYKLSVTQATAVEASTLASQTRVMNVAVTDTSNNIAQNIASLTRMGSSLSGITQAGTVGVMSLTGNQWLANQKALAKITNNYEVQVTEVTADTAASIGASLNVVGLSINDTSAQISRQFDSIKTVQNKVQSINQTNDTVPIELSVLQWQNGNALLSKISSQDYKLAVSNVKLAELDSVSQDTHVTKIAVNDASQNIAENIAQLTALGAKLTKINQLSDVSLIALTKTQVDTHAATLDKIEGNYKLGVKEVLAADASAVSSRAHVGAIYVKDSSLNLQSNFNALNAIGVKLAEITQVSPPATLNITADQLYTGTDVLSKIADSYTLNVSGVSASQAMAVAINERVTALTVSDSSDAIAQNLGDLQAIGTQLTSIAQLGQASPLKLTQAQYYANSGALTKITGDYSLNVQDASASETPGLLVDTHIVNVDVKDSAFNLNSFFDGLVSASDKVGRVTLTNSSPQISLTADQWLSTGGQKIISAIAGSFAVDIAELTAEDAVAASANKSVRSVSVLDSSANIALKLDALQALGMKLDSITQSDVSTMNISATQLIANQETLSKFENAYTLNVHDVTAANAANVSGRAVVTSFDVLDTSANIARHWDTLAQLDPKLTTIEQSESATMFISATQLLADAAALDSIQGDYSLTVTDVSAENAVAIAARSNVDFVMVKDNVANISAHFDAIAGLGSELSRVIFTEGDTLNLSAEQFSENSETLGKISSAYKLNISNALAESAIEMISNRLTNFVESVSVKDISAIISDNWSELNALGSRLVSIEQTGDLTPITMTATTLSGSVNTLTKFVNAYALNVTDVEASDAMTISGMSSDVTLAVKDTAANISSYIADLQQLGTTVTAIELTAPGQLQLTALEVLENKDAIEKIADVNLHVTEVAVSSLGRILDIDGVASVDLTDTRLAIQNKWDDLIALGENIGSVNFTDSDMPMNLTASQYAAGNGLIGKIESDYRISLSQVSAANVLDLLENSDIESVSVLDTGANIVTKLAELKGVSSQIVSISQTDPDNLLTLAKSEWRDNSVVWPLFDSQLSVKVTGVLASEAASLANMDGVRLLDVADTHDNISTDLDAINRLGAYLNTVTLTQGADDNIELTYEQLGQSQALLEKIEGQTFKLIVSDVPAENATSISSNTDVLSFGISDSAENVAAFISQLQTVASQTPSLLTAIDLGSDSQLALTQAQSDASPDALSLLSSDVTVVIVPEPGT